MPVLNDILFIGLPVVSLILPGAGGLALLFGYAIADKQMAYVQAPEWLGGFLYVTEPVLAALFARLMFNAESRRRIGEKLLDWRSPWPWFLGLGALNLIRGLTLASFSYVARDSMIVFYAVISIIVFASVKSERHLKIVFLVLLSGLFVHYILFFINPHLFPKSLQTTASMYVSILSLFLFARASSWKKFQPLVYVVSVLMLMRVFGDDSRTIWLSLTLAIFFMFGVSAFLRLSLASPAKLGAVSLASIAAVCTTNAFFWPQQNKILRQEFDSIFMGTNSPNLMTRIAMWEDAIQAVIPVSEPLFDALDRKILNPFLFGSAERPHDYAIKKELTYEEIEKKGRVDTARPKEKAKPAIRPKREKKSPLGIPEKEASLAAGPVEPVIMEAAPADVLKPAVPPVEVKPEEFRSAFPVKEELLKVESLPPAQLRPVPMEESKGSFVQAGPREENVLNVPKEPVKKDLTVKLFPKKKPGTSAIEPIPAPVASKIQREEPAPPVRGHFTKANRVFRFFIGVPFGYQFIPGRISPVFFTDRYDPHNSIIAMLYRGGVIGLFLFFTILVKESFSALREARASADPYFKEAVLACVCGLGYHFLHSLTDVTLENSFKGAPFWILIGLLMAVRAMNKDEALGPDRS